MDHLKREIASLKNDFKDFKNTQKEIRDLVLTLKTDTRAVAASVGDLDRLIAVMAPDRANHPSSGSGPASISVSSALFWSLGRY